MPNPKNIFPGMGALPQDEGVAFRVWAPNAEKVYVTGTFNEWSDEDSPMVREEAGTWYAFCEDAEPGDEYKYIIINGEQKIFRIDPYSKILSNDDNSIVYGEYFDWSEDNFNMPPWNELVMYQMHIGTFHSKSKENPGNFYTAIEKLDYLKDLGINAIELMPVNEFPGKFSWGYDLIHLYAIERSYGGPTAMKKFILEAHKRGIAVFLDVVYNHIGPIGHDLWRFDGWGEGEWGGIYFYNDERCQTPWGDTRFDYNRGEVRQYLRDNVMMYLEEFHNDGYRWDGTAFIRNVKGTIGNDENDLPEGWSLMAWINDEVRAKYPFKLSIAEDLKDEKLVCKPSSEGGMAFDTQWDPTFSYPLRELLIAPNDEERDMEKLRELLNYHEDLTYFSRVIFSESHDTVANGMKRIPEEIWPGNVGHYFSKKRSALGVALALTSPGIPMIFQGQELLEDRWFHEKDPVDWSRLEEYRGLWLLFKELIALRRNFNNQTEGLKGHGFEIQHLNNETKIISFYRFHNKGPKDDVMIVANLKNETHYNYKIGFPRGGVWKTRFNSDSKNYDPDFGDIGSVEVEAFEGEHDEGAPFTGEISIAPYSIVIFSQDE